MAEHNMFTIQPARKVEPSEKTTAPWPPSTEFTKGTNSYGEPQTQSLIKLCELPRRTPADAGLPGRVLSPLTWRLDLNLGDLTYEK